MILQYQGGSAPFFGGEKIAGKRTEMVLRDAGSDIQCGGRTNHHLPQYAGGTWMADTLPIFCTNRKMGQIAVQACKEKMPGRIG